jgi:hypothetical protein
MSRAAYGAPTRAEILAGVPRVGQLRTNKTRETICIAENLLTRGNLWRDSRPV